LNYLHNITPLSSQIATWLSRAIPKTSILAVEEFSAALGTTTGEDRSENQDRVVAARYVDPNRRGSSFLLFALCDGMGGMLDGAKCAEIALSVVLESLIAGSNTDDSQSRIRNAIFSANAAVNQRYNGRGGTTLSAVLINEQGSVIAVSIGDSRIYDAPNWKRIRQISVDDTIAGELQRLRGIKPTDSSVDYLDRIAQYVGLGTGIEPRFYILRSDMGKLAFLLTSDGAHLLPPQTFEQVIINAGTPREIVRRLITSSLWYGGRDNASVIAVSGEVSSFKSALQSTTGAEVLELWDSTGNSAFFVESMRLRTFAPHAVFETTKKSESHGKHLSPPSKYEKRHVPSKRYERKTYAARKKEAAENKKNKGKTQTELAIEVVSVARKKGDDEGKNSGSSS
jgi:serine/threonine protein phosphatase PrpC